MFVETCNATVDGSAACLLTEEPTVQTHLNIHFVSSAFCRTYIQAFCGRAQNRLIFPHPQLFYFIESRRKGSDFLFSELLMDQERIRPISKVK